MTRVLEIILTEVLVRLHVEGLGIHVYDQVDSVVVKLTSCVGSEEFMALRQIHVADERVLEFTDDGVRLIVGQAGAEAYSSVLKADGQGKVHLQGLSTVYEILIGNSDHISLL